MEEEKVVKAPSKLLWKDRKRTIFGLPLSFTRYRLTEKKLVTSIGFFSLHEDELDLYKVTDKSLSLPFWQRIFGCGTIRLNVIDTDTPVKLVVSVKRPREVLELLDEAIAVQKDKYNIRGRDVTGTADHLPTQ